MALGHLGMANWPKSGPPVLMEITKSGQVDMWDRLLLVNCRLLQHSPDPPLRIDDPPELPHLGLVILLHQPHHLMYFIIDLFLSLCSVVALMGSAQLVVLLGTVELGPVDDGLLRDVGLVDVGVFVDGAQLGVQGVHAAGSLVLLGLVRVVL